MRVSQFMDYKQYLKSELKSRLQKNPNYSLRSFAQFLEVSPSHLSRVINGQKKISATLASKLSLKLKHGSTDTQHFADLVHYELTDNDEIKSKLLEKISRRASKNAQKILTVENFKAVSEWYHFAIIGLTKLNGFQANSKWISQRLGISELECEIALDRLFHLEMLKIEDGKVVENTEGKMSTVDDIASLAIKKNHEQNIDKSKISLFKDPVDFREFNNCTVSIKKKDLPLIKKKIRKIFYDFMDELDTQGGDELYQLNLQFFQLTKDCGGEKYAN